MRRTCAAFALLALVAACGDPATPAAEQARAAAFDTTVASTAALGPDAGDVRVTHTFYAAEATEPIRWSRTVSSAADTLLHETGDSADLDAFFQNTAAFDACATAETCRRRWFARAFAAPTLDTLDAGPLDAYEREIARGFLLDEGRAQAETDALLDALDAHYTARPRVTIQFTESPTSSGPVWVYHPRLRRLVPVYTD